MKKILLYTSLILCFFSCKNEKDITTTHHNSVEKRKPNTDYTPAFDGQTRAPKMVSQSNYEVEIIAEDIGKPWSIKDLPDNRLLVTDQSGYAQIFLENGNLDKKIEGFLDVVFEGQGGLLDIVLDPNFENNNLIYWTFSEAYENGTVTAVAKGLLIEEESSIINPQVIFRATPAYNGHMHYGSRLVFDKDGFLYVSTGERSNLETRPQAQELNSYLGKIIKIDKNGNPAPNNPFLTDAQAKDGIYSYGHRNVQGLAIHPQTKELWSSEMGPKGGDELNLIHSSKNYGWPIISYGLEYNADKIGEGITKKEGMEQPRYYWDPSISPSGITFYNGKLEEWKNNLFLACLSGQHIIRLKIVNNRIVGEERLLENEQERFRDIHQARNGVLYAITDSGKIYKIE